MSDAEQTPRDTVLLPDGIVRHAQIVVQCATQIGEPTPENPDGQFCGNVIEGAAEITFEPGMVAEMAIECPACSKRVSEHMGQPVAALIPLALLIGEQVEESLPAEGEEDDDVDAAGDGDDVDEPVVELTPEDQGAAE